MRTCANETCENEFEPKSKTQKYCTPACCKEATNRRILKKYHEERSRKAGRARYCAQCAARLSRYNEDILCEICDKEKTKTEYNDTLLEIMQIASRRNQEG
jgi:hypothetical protein